ncbi:hypothetical protein ANO11243_029460 [Dothideomycetidae sp. 11243]|nr:hypothetical protein ANO11243_029460 [fungal sp. No.11243]
MTFRSSCSTAEAKAEADAFTAATKSGHRLCGEAVLALLLLKLLLELVDVRSGLGKTVKTVRVEERRQRGGGGGGGSGDESKARNRGGRSSGGWKDRGRE